MNAEHKREAIGASRATAAGSATALVAQAGLMVSGIIVARALGPADRGLLALVTLVPFVLWQLGSLGLPLSATYVIARDQRAAGPVSSLLKRATAVQTAVLVPVAAAIAIALVHDRSSEAVIAALIAIATIPAQLIHRYGLSILQATGRLVPFSVVLLMPVAAWVTAVAAFALADALELLTATIAYLASIALSALISLALARRAIEPALATEAREPPSLGWMARFGIRGLLASAPVVQTYRLDQAIVAIFLSAASLGYFVVAGSLANLPRFVSRNIGLLAFADTARLDSREAKREMWRYFRLALVAYGSVAVLLWAAAPWLVPFFFGDAFEESVPIVRVLLIASLLASSQRILIDAALGIGRPGLASLSELALLITLAPAAAILTGSGPEGVAWALVIASGAGLLTAIAGAVLGRPGEQVQVAPELAADADV